MTNEIGDVLLAVGPNDREHVSTILDAALGVVIPTGARITLLHVFPRSEYESLLEKIDSGVGNIEPDELAARHEGLKTPVARLDDAGVDYEIRGVIGDPDVEIVRLADDLNVDRIFIGGSSRSPTGKAVFGDHAQQVLLNASCPVTYVQRE